MNFFSEYGEDRWVYEHAPLPKDGFYLDVGAAHPTHTSNTAWLRELGWPGLAIDGNACWRAMWAGVAPFVHTVLAKSPEVGFRESFLSSRITGYSPRVKARRLDDVLSEHGVKQIDFLSVDAEGYEFEIFETFDVMAYKPAVIISEYNTGGIGMDFRVLEHLKALGYREAHRTISSIIYLR